MMHKRTALSHGLYFLEETHVIFGYDHFDKS